MYVLYVISGTGISKLKFQSHDVNSSTKYHANESKTADEVTGKHTKSENNASSKKVVQFNLMNVKNQPTNPFNKLLKTGAPHMKQTR